MGYNNVKRKITKLSFIERAQRTHIPKTYRHLESFLESNNRVYI